MNKIKLIFLVVGLALVSSSCVKRYSCKCYTTWYSDPSLNNSETNSLEAKNLGEASTKCSSYEVLDNSLFYKTCTLE